MITCVQVQRESAELFMSSYAARQAKAQAAAQQAIREIMRREVLLNVFACATRKTELFNMHNRCDPLA